MDLFKVLDRAGVLKFQEWAKDHDPSESWSWETLHPVVKAVWSKHHTLCLECGKSVSHCDSSFKHAEREPPRVLLKSYLMAAFDSDKEESKFKWYPTDEFWGADLNGMFVGVEVDGYVHS